MFLGLVCPIEGHPNIHLPLINYYVHKPWDPGTTYKGILHASLFFLYDCYVFKKIVQLFYTW